MQIDDKMPRGIRNNNPGNIRLSSSKWQGQKAQQFDPAFVEFDAPLMGVRALMRLLMNYHLRHGLDSVESIINRYAPPHENATDGYISVVAKHLGVARRDVIDLRRPKTLVSFAQAIVRHENGKPPAGAPPFWYGPDLYFSAATLVLKGD